MPKNGTIAYLSKAPGCDFCLKSGRQTPAKYDFLTRLGSWAYGCEAHWTEYRVFEDLGIGKGQIIEIK